MVQRLENKIYTVRQIADILGISKCTIGKLFNSGKLKGFRVPGSRHRRIPYKSLIVFCEENEIPADVIEQYYRYNPT